MTTLKEVKKLVEESRDRFHFVLEVASEEDHIDSARGRRPRGVLVCGGATNDGLQCPDRGKEIRKT